MTDSEWIDKLMANRRSIFPKDYTGERVDDSIVQQLLVNAHWAPTHKLTEPWRFVVFTGNGLQKLAEFQADCYQQVTTKDGTFSEEKQRNLLTKPLQSSHIIAVGMKRDERGSVPEVEELGAVFCAIENMYLTATAYGIGCYLSTGGITYFEEAKDFFGLGKNDRLIGFLHVGKVKEPLRPGKRKSLADKVKWVKD